MTDEIWDPFGTLANTLWIGGAQWAGKSTVARVLAMRYGLTAYHHDYHDARAHNDRRVARRAERGERLGGPEPDEAWVRPSPEELAKRVLEGFPQCFEWILDDLRALVSGRPIVAEGWGLRPELVVPLLDSTDRMVVMVPTEEFRQHQLHTLPRASSMAHLEVSDPQRAQRNRVARDRLIAEDAVRSAGRLGITVLEVDGTLDAESVAAVVAERFAPYLDYARQVRQDHP